MSHEPDHVLEARAVRRLARRLTGERGQKHLLAKDELAYVLAGLRLLSEGLDGEGLLMTTLRGEGGRVGPTTRLR